MPLRTGLASLVSPHLSDGSSIAVAGESAAERLTASAASPGLVGGEAVRAGLHDIAAFTYDDEWGTYEEVGGLWLGVHQRGWRGAAWVSRERELSLLEGVASSPVGASPAGRAVDREPWHAVIGSSR